MQICVISSTVFRVHGPRGLSQYAGLEIVAWLLARGLAQKGHQVTLVAPDGSECPGVGVLPVGPERQVDERTAFQKYWQHLLEVEVVIDHSWQKHAYLLKQDGKLKAPVLGVCHAPVNTMFQSLPAVEKPCFVCISEDQRTHFEALFARPARTAHNGLELGFYQPIPGMKRSDRFLFLARFSTIKGADLAIDACLEAGVGLDLVGDTSITNEPEYLEKCKRKADGKQIRLIGPCTRAESVWWFSQAKCLLHPNQRFREPFGLAPVEAQACGTPVVTWDHGAMRETVKHGETGFLVQSMPEFVAHVRQVACPVPPRPDFDPEVCRTWAKQFSVERMVNRYEALCHEALTTGGW